MDTINVITVTRHASLAAALSEIVDRIDFGGKQDALVLMFT